ncbi:MAG: glycosyltransferase [Bacteroidota bacterium]|nr:glycosyltransferase [Bacteroidota bacterium]
MESFLTWISLILIPLIGMYAAYILFYYRGLTKLSNGTNLHQHTTTVIIPARNEENNIHFCIEALLKQTYPSNLFTIVVIDDQSTDNTAKVVNEFVIHHPERIKLISIQERPKNISPKINALKLGIEHSTSDLILTTDADCWTSENWISSTVSFFEENVGVTTGLTVYADSKTISPLFRGMQYLDFISYTAIGAGGIGMNALNTCNGSNMAFRRSAFESIGGFESLSHLNTGDDSLLAQKIVQTKKWDARFVQSPNSFVTTHAVSTWKEFFHQRMRWAGQTTEYPPLTLLFMINTFLLYLGLTVAVPLTLLTWNAIPWIVLGIKFFVDYLIMRKFTMLTHTQAAMRYFLPMAVIHIPVIVFSVFGGFFGQFRWKDQTMSRTAS